MENGKFKIIYEDKDLLVIDKPAGINSDNFERRVHRLDKDTSGILLIAKSDKVLDFFQKQFKERKVIKKYLALVVGEIKDKKGEGDEAKASSSPFANARVIETLIGRSPKNRLKQKIYLVGEPNAQGKRDAITEYKVLKRFKNYTLIEVEPKTGRKHQIRCHFAYLGYPIAGDKMYGFKNRAFQRKAKVKMKQGFIDNQPGPKDLKRQFLHASYLKIKLLNAKEKEFRSNLSNDLKKVLKNLITYDN